MRGLSIFLSSLFHPMWVPLAGFVLIYLLGGFTLFVPEAAFNFALIVIVQFTILIPLVSIYFLLWRKKISSVQLPLLKERPLPLLINLVSVALVFYILYKMGYPKMLVGFFVATALVSALAFFVSLFYKISLHMLAWGGITGIFVAFGFKTGLSLHLLISISVMISGLVASARLYLNAHVYHQVYIAWLVSASVAFIVFYMF